MAHMNGVKSGPLVVRYPFAAALLGGLIAGALYIAFALLFLQATPEQVFHAIAAGLLGRDAAIAGGMETAIVGAAAHFFISFAAAAIYVLATAPFPVLLSRPILGGFIFGVCVWAVTSYVAAPSLLLTAPPADWPATAIMIAGYTFFFGVPIAWVSRTFAGRK